MEIDLNSKAVMIAWTIALNLVGYMILDYLTFSDTGCVLMILTVINSTVILLRKLNKIQRLLEKDEEDQ